MNDPKQTEKEYYDEKFHETFPSESRTSEDDEWEENNPDRQYIPDEEDYNDDSDEESDDWESTWSCG